MKKRLKVGDIVPDFTLRDQNGKEFIFAKDQLKEKTIIFFYPKDDSLICTKQACAFRDSYSELAKYRVKTIGINSGSEQSHQQFDQNHQLGITLLSDTNNSILNLFGVKKILFFTGRETFVIDTTGKIVFKYVDFFGGKSHLKIVLKFLDSND